VGEQSSRRIERRCVEDVAFRVVAANQQPDHCTIARFRQRHAEALCGLFAQVLACCAAAGLVRVDLVAVDGTKMRANASKDANRLRDELAQEVAGWLRDADDVDAAEDAQGDGSPRENLARQDRRQRIREALRQAQVDTTSNQWVRRNVSDPDSRLMKGRQGFLQGYNGQAMATVDLVVIAAELSMNPIDHNELLPMIETAHKTLEAANVDATIGVVVADAGYWSQHNATAEVDCELLIATTTADKQAQGPQPAVAARIAADDKERIRDRAELDRRVDILERRDRGEITTEQASGELGLSRGSCRADQPPPPAQRTTTRRPGPRPHAREARHEREARHRPRADALWAQEGDDRARVRAAQSSAGLRSVRLPWRADVRHRVEADEHHAQPPQTVAALTPTPAEMVATRGVQRHQRHRRTGATSMQQPLAHSTRRTNQRPPTTLGRVEPDFVRLGVCHSTPQSRRSRTR
jgi:Transposase domain (DUF772)